MFNELSAPALLVACHWSVNIIGTVFRSVEVCEKADNLAALSFDLLVLTRHGVLTCVHR